MTADPSTRIEAISLDFYGTLIHPRDGRGRGTNLVDYLRAEGLEPGPYEHRMLYEIFGRHDLDYSPAAPEDDRKRYLAELTARALGCLGVSTAEAPPQRHAEAVWHILGPDAFVPYPETSEVLAELRRAGYPLLLLSNWQRGLAHFVAELGLADAFDHLICSAELGVAKPDSAIFAAACESVGVPPERVLHVGDTPADDYEGSRRAGLQAILIDRAAAAPADGIETIADLREILPRLAARGSRAD